MTFKEKTYQRFQDLMHEKIALLQRNLDSLFLSAQNETKRTAGDKHETALAMLQIEQENLRHQLNEAKNQQSVLMKINPSAILTKVASGALVRTNHGYFFISLALGKISVDNTDVFSLSPQSPLGACLTGLIPGQEFTLNGRNYFLHEIT